MNETMKEVQFSLGRVLVNAEALTSCVEDALKLEDAAQFESNVCDALSSAKELVQQLEAAKLAIHRACEAQAAPVRRRAISAKLDRTSSRGLGTKEYRLVIHEDRTYWADQAPGAIKLDGGKVELDEGTLIISIDKEIKRGGTSVSYAAGMIVPPGTIDGEPSRVIAWEGGDVCPIRHVGTKPGNVHVIERKATGERFEVRPA